MNKQAFLIIAHNEFKMLQKLIDSLDDESNDIYVHIDARIKQMPLLQSKHSKLAVLTKRMKITWGTVSQPKCEMLMMQTALESGIHYEFYHIISGTHYPLVSQSEFKDFFRPYIGKSVLQIMPASEEEKCMRFGRYHFFMRYFISGPKIIKKMYRFCWKANLFIQKRLHITRDYSHILGKASNWCSLSDNAVNVIINNKRNLKKIYSHTFCGDEYFVPSLLAAHKLPIVNSDKLLFLEFVKGNPRVLDERDYVMIKESGCIFGRKFTMPRSASLIERLKYEQN